MGSSKQRHRQQAKKQREVGIHTPEEDEMPEVVVKHPKEDSRKLSRIEAAAARLASEKAKSGDAIASPEAVAAPVVVEAAQTAPVEEKKVQPAPTPVEKPVQKVIEKVAEKATEKAVSIVKEVPVNSKPITNADNETIRSPKAAANSAKPAKKPAGFLSCFACGAPEN